MRKILLYLIVVLLLNTRSHILQAQPEPQYYKAAPNFLLSVLDDTSPAKVIKSALTLEYDKEEYSKTFTGINRNATIGCTIIVRYSILNPTDESIKVRMGLPFVSTLQNYNPNDLKITVDDKVTDLGLLIGENISLYSKTDLETVKIPKDITKNKFNADQKGKLYVFNVKNQCTKSVTFALKFNELKSTPLFSYGFEDDISNKPRNYDLYSSIIPNASEAFQLFTLDEDIEYTYACFLDKDYNGASVEYTNPTDDYTCTISSSECTLMDFILLNEREMGNPYISDEQVFSTILSDSTTTGLYDRIYQLPNKGYNNHLSSQKLMVATFESEISSQSTREIEVIYTVPCSSEIINNQSIYTFDYLFSPDHGWADFNNIQLVIKTSPEISYIISSNIKYERFDDNIYTAYLDKLPNYNLSMQFSNKQYQVSNNQNKGTQLMYLGIMSIIAIIILISVIKLKSKMP